MDICVTGLNHKRAPVELRERLAVGEASLASTLAELQPRLEASEMVVLSTCNRVELYTVHDGPPPDPKAVAAVLAERRGVPVEALAPVLYRHAGSDAVRHLFRVAASLDSMVLGETQIIGQVRDAYLAAKDVGGTGRVLNRLFQQALAVAKRVHGATALAEKHLSVSSVAAKLAGKIFQDLSTKSLLVLGAGETAELTVEAFKGRGTAALRVVNRTLENARALAERWGATAHGLDELPALLARSDVVIACLSVDAPVLTAGLLRDVMKARREEPLFLIDIAVPRNIEREADRLENVYLYDIDDLQAIVQQNAVEREKEVARALPIIEEETGRFLKEVTPPDVTALLTALRERLHALGDEETRRTLARLNGLTEAQKAEVQELTRRLVNKILHAPLEALRAGGQENTNPSFAEMIRKLFGLNK